MHRIVPAAFALLAWSSGSTAPADDFLSSQRAFQQQRTDEQQSFEEHKKEFDAYKKKLLEEFDAYKAAAAKVWGKKDAQISTRETWVEYDRGMTERSAVDFENGSVKVEIAVAPGTDPAAIEKQLADAIQKLMTRPADSRDLGQILLKPDDKPKHGIKPLDGMVQDKDGREVTPERSAEFARDLVRNLATSTRTGTDGRSRLVAGVQFGLVPDHIRKRADRFRDRVRIESSERKIPPELVLAVIESESYFNPMAQSHVPAFGLMQLVPTSGGREAYRFVNGRDGIPTPSFLFNPDNNITLGAGYLHVLYHRYFANVEDRAARLWCAIAGYNTGPSNVLRAFGGKYERAVHGSRANWEKQAYQKLNAMTPEQVFGQLRANLPYEETRHYVKKVRERMDKYVGYVQG